MLRWLVSTVTKTITETPDAVSLWLDVPEWGGIERASTLTFALPLKTVTRRARYSIASSPGADGWSCRSCASTDGEVSPYLTGLAVGDHFEIRGPIGGYFVWEKSETRPVTAPRGRFGRRAADVDVSLPRGTHAGTPFDLVYSARTEHDLLIAKSSRDGEQVTRRLFTLTRDARPPRGPAGAAGSTTICCRT